MSTWIMPPEAGLIETSFTQEIGVDGIGAIELVNGSIRVYLYSDQLPLECSDAPPGKLVAVKLRGPLVNVPQIIGQLAMCLWKPGKERTPLRGCPPHLVV